MHPRSVAPVLEPATPPPVGMTTEVHCSPPNRAGRRSVDDIDISVPLKSDEDRILHEFDKAISDPSGIIPIRLAIGDHVGMWSVRTCRFVGDSALYTLFFLGNAEKKRVSCD